MTVGPAIEVRDVARTPDGVSLGWRRRDPVGPARGTVLALHAMMVDSRTLDRPDRPCVAATLQGAGWRVLSADFRGRGLSPVPRGADWSYADLVLRDVPTLLRAARATGPGPVVVVGHSLGGHVTAASLASGVAQADALALVAANVWLGALEPSLPRRLRKAATLRAFDGVARVAGGMPARRLGIGPVDEARGYATDLAATMRRGWWGTRDGRIDWWRGLAGVDTPVSAWIATGDRLLAHLDGAAAFAAQAGGEAVVVGQGGAGVDGDPDHMGIVTDPACAPAWSRLAAWLNAVTSA